MVQAPMKNLLRTNYAMFLHRTQYPPAAALSPAAHAGCRARLCPKSLNLSSYSPRLMPHRLACSSVSSPVAPPHHLAARPTPGRLIHRGTRGCVRRGRTNAYVRVLDRLAIVQKGRRHLRVKGFDTLATRFNVAVRGALPARKQSAVSTEGAR